jgi:hypothetical protein
MFFRTALSALALTGLLSFSAQAVPLYTQLVGTNSGWTSQTDPNFGNLYTVYDNFTLTNDASVTDLTWVGSYFDNLPIVAVPGAITGWTISFYADDLFTDSFGSYTVPGTLLATESFSGLANESLLSGLSYSYSHTLATAVNLQAGVQYWVSIVADLDSENSGLWAWRDGLGGDGRVIQLAFGNLWEQSPDAAFSLSGDLVAAAVPELDPGRSSLPLAFVGCILGVLAGRRRVLS